ncbi:MAG: hypothetical protein JRJ58_23645, partial [Deltaproteobacteria bacterium]|nr:hypothetical protein [Deltaproteobacteria bacterium]
DGDGDLDIVSHAFDDYGELHLWRNDAPVAPITEPVPEVSADAGATLALGTLLLIRLWAERRRARG